MTAAPLQTICLSPLLCPTVIGSLSTLPHEMKIQTSSEVLGSASGSLTSQGSLVGLHFSIW